MTQRERRQREVGRRTTDIDLTRARKRLKWTYAAVSAVLVVVAVVAASDWL